MNENDISLSKVHMQEYVHLVMLSYDTLLIQGEFEANLHSLNEMFDMLPKNDVRKALLNNDVMGAVNHLIHQVEVTNSATPKNEVL